MDELMKEIGNLQDYSGMFSMWDVAIALCLSFVMSLLIAKVYKETHRGVSYSQSFTQTLILMSVVVALIMLIIGSNIARAFALVGALSIIRFRNAVKESRDVGFLFFAMAIGMSAGTRFFFLAIFSTLLICAFIVIVYRLDLFRMEIRERILMIQIPDDLDYEGSFRSVFERYFTDVNLISIETVERNEVNELIYSVTLRRELDPLELLAELRALNGNNRVSLIEGQQQVDL